MMSIWLGTIDAAPNVPEGKKPLLNAAKLRAIQKKAKELTLPYGVESTHLITNMTSGKGFSQFRAIDWKIWTMMMSPYCLAGILEQKYLDNWMLFVRALRIMCAPTVSIKTVGEAHTLFKAFVKGVHNDYGESAVTINHHNLLHSIFDVIAHGPYYSFWLFYYERLNKDMKTINNNQRQGVEKTLLKGFCKMSYYEDYVNSFPSKIREQLNVIQEYRRLNDTTYIPSLHSLRTHRFVHLSDIEYATRISNWNYPIGNETMPTSITRSIKTGNLSVMPKDDYSCLQSFYAKHSPLYNHSNINTINNKIYKFDKVNLLGDAFKSKREGKFDI